MKTETPKNLQMAHAVRIGQGIASKNNTIRTVKANIDQISTVKEMAELCGVSVSTLRLHLKAAGYRLVFKAVLERV